MHKLLLTSPGILFLCQELLPFQPATFETLTYMPYLQQEPTSPEHGGILKQHDGIVQKSTTMVKAYLCTILSMRS